VFEQSRIFAVYGTTQKYNIYMIKLRKKKPIIKYSGSAIQQDHGESIGGHGFLVWDVKNRKSEFVKLDNDFGYYTFHLVNGKCEIPDNLPKNLRVRIKHENTQIHQLEEFKKYLSEKYKIVELSLQKVSNAFNSLEAREDLLGDSRSVDYQNGIIRKFLAVNPDVTEDDIEELCKLNYELNKRIPLQNAVRNITWKPLRLEFSNMFSYGEGNYIDFTDFKGIYGLFAKNYSGKSSLFDILTFVIFDKSTRATKAGHVLNNSKKNFRAKFSFEIAGQVYFIERVGTLNEKTGSVKVDVNFWTEEDGIEVMLNREDRDKTNYAIRDFLGTYDDFVMVSMSTQYDNKNFVDTTQKDRKELLYKFLDIFIYDDLFRLAKEESKEYQTLIKELEKDDLTKVSSMLTSLIEVLKDELKDLEKSLEEVESDIKEKNTSIITLSKEYRQTDIELDIAHIKSQIEYLTMARDGAGADLQSIIVQENELVSRRKELQKIVKRGGAANSYSELVDKYRDIQTKVDQSKRKYEGILSEYKNAQAKKEHLDKHEYDPNCEFCTNNEFVKDAQKAIESMPQLLDAYASEFDTYRILISELEKVERDLSVAKYFDKVVRELESVESKLAVLNTQKEATRYKGKTLQENIKEWKEKEVEYAKNSAIIEKNARIEENIKSLKTELCALEQRQLELKKQIRIKYSEVYRKEQELDLCNSKLDKYLSYKKRYRIYELYLQTMSREGIPYKIVETVLPVIENEVNQILNQIVDFTVRLEATGEKYIHGYIVYDEKRYWPIELTSGMERFVLSLAFRAALSEITALPKTNFLAIDEGFGVLDKENMTTMESLFSLFKERYDFIVIVSHIDTMRDFVDKTIGITKLNGYSKLEASKCLS
jgi:DNA repair exonuclease SbcCD ATPase subunit